MRASTQQVFKTRSKNFGISSTYVWLGVMVLLWGSSWPVTKLALHDVPPLWLATIRFASAAVCLVAYLVARGQLKLPVRGDMPIIASVGLLQMMAFTGLGMVAMVHVDTSRAVLLAYTTPLWCVVVAWVMFREMPSRLQIAGLVIGMSGIAAVCSPGELEWTNRETVLGAIFLLLAAVSWAIVILHVKRHRWVTPPLALAPWQMLLATIPLAIAAYVSEGPPTSLVLDRKLAEELFFIGPIATSACFVISAEYGRRISTFGMSNFTLGVPLIGTVFSCLAFGATVSTMFLAGLGLVVLGVVVSALASRSRRT
ncbi:DMT family transporter [Pseudomonas putida]|uniref:EamA family transporter n=1 Tax=Pseudomonas putida TaxID=303 RepID=A0AAD0L6D5_PSEPU|nr:EamA family transporter [Pseudomonas putida]ANC01848.1 membrane protein [Pseudomonas putida]AXA23470.1 EamA family transporter [Pseudomonas putida]